VRAHLLLSRYAGEGYNHHFFIRAQQTGVMVNQHARELRRHQTDAEKLLWRLLRNRRLADHKFRRQHPIGQFIVDFACVELHLVVEADGGQHAESAYDQWRTAHLEAEGWRVVRFWNNVLRNTGTVIEVLLGELASCGGEHPHPPRERAATSPAGRAR
jgi:very-short-patch-repair endonuclease